MKLLTTNQRVTKNLVNKEDAIGAMAEDYRRDGKVLIEGFEKARKQEYDAYKAKNSQARAGLVKVFQEAEKEVASKATKFKKEVVGLKADWEKSQRKVNGSVDALLAMCSE